MEKEMVNKVLEELLAIKNAIKLNFITAEKVRLCLNEFYDALEQEWQPESLLETMTKKQFLSDSQLQFLQEGTQENSRSFPIMLDVKNRDSVEQYLGFAPVASKDQSEQVCCPHCQTPYRVQVKSSINKLRCAKCRNHFYVSQKDSTIKVTKDVFGMDKVSTTPGPQTVHLSSQQLTTFRKKMAALLGDKQGEGSQANETKQDSPVVETPSTAEEQKTDNFDFYDDSKHSSPQEMDLSQPADLSQGMDLSQPADLSQGMDLSQPADLSQGMDLSQPADLSQGMDLSQPADLSQGMDLSQPADLSQGMDLSQPADLSQGMDLSQPADLSQGMDLSQPADLSQGMDLSQPADLSQGMDLSQPADLSQGMDLSQPTENTPAAPQSPELPPPVDDLLIAPSTSTGVDYDLDDDDLPDFDFSSGNWQEKKEDVLESTAPPAPEPPKEEPKQEQLPDFDFNKDEVDKEQTPQFQADLKLPEDETVDGFDLLNISKKAPASSEPVGMGTMELDITATSLFKGKKKDDKKPGKKTTQAYLAQVRDMFHTDSMVVLKYAINYDFISLTEANTLLDEYYGKMDKGEKTDNMAILLLEEGYVTKFQYNTLLESLDKDKKANRIPKDLDVASRNNVEKFLGSTETKKIMRITCPNCKTMFRVRVSTKGGKFRCGKCKKSFFLSKKK